jgi:hypothetical protein
MHYRNLIVILDHLQREIWLFKTSFLSLAPVMGCL